MNEINLNELYYKWICSMIFPEDLRNKYSNVLHLLHSINFQYIRPLDENRLKDGINLRYHFSCGCKIPYNIVCANFNNNTCSMLEMMTSLAKRCEDDIMSDYKYGDRTSEWFYMMFCNLGLDKYDNDRWDCYFSEAEITDILYRFMNIQYNSDGSNGNLFITNNPNIDLRNMQIWDQMCLCMNQILGY